MLLAELEIRHSRPIAPTRRVALGLVVLPCDPGPGWGGVLLAGLVAASVKGLDPEDLEDLYDLIDDLEAGRRIAQPRLRHRFQKDVVGLDRSRHSLIGEGERIYFEFDSHGLPVVNLLGATYAAGLLDAKIRPVVFRSIRKGVMWDRPLGDAFVAHVLENDAAFSRWRALPTDTRWALKMLGFAIEETPSRDDVQGRFRELIRLAHPDHGGSIDGAGPRMVELTQARKILLAVEG